MNDARYPVVGLSQGNMAAPTASLLLHRTLLISSYESMLSTKQV
jgi:hypothetical protein